MTVYNFAAGPAMLPLPVMRQIQKEFLDWRGLGISVIEISHRSKEFIALLAETDELFRQVSGVPENFAILYCHGGAQMQFSMVPMNLIGLRPARKALYVETGNFAQRARQEAEKFGEIEVVASGEAGNFARLPDLRSLTLDKTASYIHLTSNNTLYGTQWTSYPDTQGIPLVVDATSDILSRPMDWNQIGVLYAGAQKNLGPAGIAMAIVRKDLLGHAGPHCPRLMDYQTYAQNQSMANTPNTFAMYAINLVLKWQLQEGGLKVMQQRSLEKARLLYETLDQSSFYQGTADPQHRSLMNVTFVLPNEALLELFLSEALANGLVALKGHRAVGGVRASIYNPMPLAGVRVLADFMQQFEKTRG